MKKNKKFGSKPVMSKNRFFRTALGRFKFSPYTYIWTTFVKKCCSLMPLTTESLSDSLLQILSTMKKFNYSEIGLISLMALVAVLISGKSPFVSKCQIRLRSMLRLPSRESNLPPEVQISLGTSSNNSRDSSPEQMPNAPE